MKANLLKILILLVLVSLVAGAASGCIILPTDTPTPTPQATQTPKATGSAITTEDRVLLAVHQHLLEKAESYEAKRYLTDFYDAVGKFKARSELMKDGSTVWHASVNMGGIEFKEKPYWQQACWLVFTDGKVIPCQEFGLNALRIEADLQELSTRNK